MENQIEKNMEHDMETTKLHITMKQGDIRNQE